MTDVDRKLRALQDVVGLSTPALRVIAHGGDHPSAEAARAVLAERERRDRIPTEPAPPFPGDCEGDDYGDIFDPEPPSRLAEFAVLTAGSAQGSGRDVPTSDDAERARRVLNSDADA